MRARQPAVRRPCDAGPAARGRPARLPVRRLHPHAGGARVPDRQPILRLALRVRARAVHERPAHLSRPGQGPGRLVEHQRPDLPARQSRSTTSAGRPIPGWRRGTTPTACRTSSRWRTAWPRPRTTRSAATTDRSCSNAGPRPSPLFTAFFAVRPGRRLPADRRRQRLPAGGVRGVRSDHPPRPAAVGGAGLPPPGSPPPEPDRPHADAGDRDPLRGPARRRRRDRAAGWRDGAPRCRRGDPVRRIDQLAAAPAALGRRAGERPRARSGSRSWPTCPASARTCRTTSRSTSSTGRSSRSRCSRRCSCGGGRSSARPGSSSGAGRAPPTTSRAAASSAATTTCAYPNLMFHFLPLAVRYDGSGAEGRPRLPGPRRPDVQRRARLGHDRVARSAGAPGVALQLPVDGPGSARVGRGRPRGAPAAQPAGARARTTAARRHPGRRSRPTTRSSTGSAVMPRPPSTRRARPGWGSTTRPCWIR